MDETVMMLIIGCNLVVLSEVRVMVLLVCGVDRRSCTCATMCT
jgi:hypothetical protein